MIVRLAARAGATMDEDGNEDEDEAPTLLRSTTNTLSRNDDCLSLSHAVTISALNSKEGGRAEH